jgi:membrane-bound acyltransferase YfiQ involved in biofilm formation
LLVGYPFNFVPLLIFSYAISPLLIRALRRYGVWTLLVIGAYQVLLLAVVSPREAGFQLPGFLQLIAPPVLSRTLAVWGIFFPLGLYVVQTGERTAEAARRYRLALILATGLFFVLGALDAFRMIAVPMIQQIIPLPFLLLSTAFQRSSFPAVRSFELLGKRAYGVYLTNLLVLDLGLFALQAAAPGALVFVLLLLPVMFAVALFTPLLLMSVFERRMKPAVFRYTFG